jgi:hypothetical protein
MAYTENSIMPTGEYLILFIGYLVLLVGNPWKAV